MTEQQMPPMDPYFPAAYPMPERPSDDFERWRFDIEDILREKEMNILGFFWNPKANKGQGAWEKSGESKVNNVGAKAIITAMSGIINKISTLTNLDIDEIHEEVRITTLNLNRLFFLHHKEYGMTSPSDARELLWQLAFFAFNGLKQSQGGASLKSLAEVSQTIRHIREGERESKGFLGLTRRGQ